MAKDKGYKIISDLEDKAIELLTDDLNTNS